MEKFIEVEGDIFESGADLICHQTNTWGVMGAGIARTIHYKYLSDENFAKYQQACKINTNDILGTVQFLPSTKDFVIANCFSQIRVTTNYDLFRKCMKEVAIHAKANNYSVAIPKFMGCGIAKGDWNIVREIIREELADVPCTICYLPQK